MVFEVCVMEMQALGAVSGSTLGLHAGAWRTRSRTARHPELMFSWEQFYFFDIFKKILF